MIGLFVERPDDRHVALRQQVLRQKAWYPSPEGAEAQAARADDRAGWVALVKGALETSGALQLGLDRALTTDELLDLAHVLGKPLKQGAVPLSRQYVDGDVILNLRAGHAETDDLRWGLLFAENYVTLHTELASRPAADQPRHIVLYCIEPPRRGCGGQTLLVPMEGVRRGLGDRHAAILRCTRPAGPAAAPPFLRRWRGRDVFAFKDAEGRDLPWQYEGNDPTITPDAVADAIRALLGALYEPAGVRGFHWKRGALGVIDNTRFFHGRTFVRRTAGRPPRHLRRLLIAVEEPRPSEGGPLHRLPGSTEEVRLGRVRHVGKPHARR